MKKLALAALPVALALGACGETATETTDEAVPAETTADTMANDDMMVEDTMTDDTIADDARTDDTMAADAMTDDMTAEPTDPAAEETTEPM